MNADVVISTFQGNPVELENKIVMEVHGKAKMY